MNNRLTSIDEAAQAAAIERLAQRLHFRMEPIDPQDPTEWDSLDEIDKRFYRDYVSWLLFSRTDPLNPLNAEHYPRCSPAYIPALFLERTPIRPCARR